MEQTININNHKINFYDNQVEDKIPVVMLHGWGQDYHCFDHLINAIGDKRRVIALDLSGFGKSEEPTYPYTIYDYEEEFNQIMNYLQINKFDLIAHSFGGRISIIYQTNHPGKINRLVLTGAAGIKPKKTLRNKIAAYHYKFMKFLTKTPLFCQFRQDLLKNSGSEDYRNASDMMKKVLVNTVNEDLVELISNIDVKTLLYWGAEDDATPLKDAYKFASLIKDNELEIIPNQGHFAFLFNYQDFNKKVLKFLKI